MAYSSDEVLRIIVGIMTGGRGGGVNPENPLLGIPSFGEALEQDRARRRGTTRGQPRKTARRAFEGLSGPKKPRKVSRYQRAFGVCLKGLKKKHPRTPVSKLMKKAHTCARKKRKREGW
jgi:hypothetical protein